MPSGSLVVLARGNFNYASEPGPPDTYVELYSVTSVAEVSREEFARLRQGDAPRPLRVPTIDMFADQVRSTAVFGQSEPLPLAEYPVTERWRAMSCRWPWRRKVSKPDGTCWCAAIA